MLEIRNVKQESNDSMDNLVPDDEGAYVLNKD